MMRGSITDRWMVICIVQPIAEAMGSQYVTFQSLKKSTAVGMATWVEVGVHRAMRAEALSKVGEQIKTSSRIADTQEQS